MSKTFKEYNASVGIKGGQVYGSLGGMPSNPFDAAASFLEKAGHNVMAERKRKELIDAQTIQVQSQNALTVKRAELEERIAKGETGLLGEYEKFYEETLANINNAVGDEEVRQRIENALSPQMTQSVLRVKALETKAINKNSLDQLKSSLDLLSDEYYSASPVMRENIKSNVDRQISSLVDLGVISEGDGSVTARNWLTNSEKGRIEAISLTGDYATALASLDEAKEAGVFNELEYQTLNSKYLSAMQKQIEDYNSKASAFEKVTSGIASDSDLEEYFNTMVLSQNLNMQQQFELSRVLAITSGSRKIPNSLKNNVKTLFNLPSENINLTQEDLDLTVNASRYVSSLPRDVAQKEFGNNYLKARAILSKINYGVPAQQAIRQTAITPNVEIKEGQIKTLNNKIMDSSFTSPSNTKALRDISTYYMSIGFDVDDAYDQAEDIISDGDADFLNYKVSLPPNKAFGVNKGVAEDVVSSRLSEQAKQFGLPSFDEADYFVYATEDSVVDFYSTNSSGRITYNAMRVVDNIPYPTPISITVKASDFETDTRTFMQSIESAAAMLTSLEQQADKNINMQETYNNIRSGFEASVSGLSKSISRMEKAFKNIGKDNR